MQLFSRQKSKSKSNYIHDNTNIPKWSNNRSSSIKELEYLVKINEYQIAALTKHRTATYIYRKVQIYNNNNNKWIVLKDNIKYIDHVLLFTFDRLAGEIELYYTQKGSLLNKKDSYHKCEIVFKKQIFAIIKNNKNKMTPTVLQMKQKYILLTEENIKESLSGNVFEKDYMFGVLMRVRFGGIFLDNDKQMHVIINQENEHIVWNTKTGDVFSKFLKYQFENISMRTTSFVWIPSKDIILMIGAFGCHIDNLPLDNTHYIENVGIWQYCLIEHKWTKLNIKFPYYTVECVLTNDEKYVIITGGQMYNNNKWNDDIFILDLTSEDYQLRKCKIKCPQSGNCNYWINTVILGGSKDEMLTDGWIKELFKLQQFKHLLLPPTYLIKMISQWYNQPMLHLFYGQPNNMIPARHYEIKVSTILDFIQ